jgi:ankyrin repeat protein
MIEILLNAGADVNATELNGSTALLTAVRLRKESIVENLIKAGSIPNVEAYCFDGPGHHKCFGSALIAAIEWGKHTIVKLLIDGGANIDAPRKSASPMLNACSCKTPLTTAILKGNHTLANHLIGRGAALSIPPEIRMGTRPLAAAVSLNDIEIVRVLLHAGTDPMDLKAFRLAPNNTEIRQMLLVASKSGSHFQTDTNLERSALKSAIFRRDIAMVKAILDSGLVDISSFQNGKTALHEALVHDSSPNCDVIRLILESGADPNGFVTQHRAGCQSVLLAAINMNDTAKCKFF